MSITTSEWEGDFWDKLESKLVELDQVNIEYGFYAEDVHKGTEMAMGSLAAIHEFGSSKVGIPERPFMTYSAFIAERDANDYFRLPFTDFVYKDKGIAVFNKTGRKLVRSIQTAIMQQEFVPLKPATIQKKGFSTILVEDHELINGAKFKVNGKSVD